METPPVIECSIGVMAYNEEANIGRLLNALVRQQTSRCTIKEILVIASGCVDDTEAIVRELAHQNPKIRLIVQPRREGKASAVNLFLHNAASEIVVLESADTLPELTTLESLVTPFADPDIGMTGGRPVPSNNQQAFMGFAVHLLWALHHQIALQQPKLGELIAFRRVFHRIPYDSAVDEASIEPLVRGQGYRLHYVPEALVYNRGPETIREFLKQRRRIHAGHSKMRREQGYIVSTMSIGRILMALLNNWQWHWRYFLWTPLVMALEAYGRLLGWIDVRLKKRDHAIWDIAITTKADINS
jgi:poly-beta-1,6-N-acetyl-D-glucosamine synthase